MRIVERTPHAARGQRVGRVRTLPPIAAVTIGVEVSQTTQQNQGVEPNQYVVEKNNSLQCFMGKNSGAMVA
jgi:hypothetical protein